MNLEEIEEINEDNAEEFIEHLTEMNSLDYCYRKLAEEAIELAEVCLKKVNKKPNNAPSEDMIFGEISDVIIRCNILMYKLGHSVDKDPIVSKMKEKLNKLLKWSKEGEYSQM